MKKMLCMAVLACGLAASGVAAAPVEADQWYTFGFGERGSPLLPGKPGFTTIDGTIPAPDAPWTFSVPGGGRLIVADAFQSGDRFQIFDFGRSIGRTSSPRVGFDCGTDLYCALAITQFSRGIFDLEPGEYSITGTAISSPTEAGAGAFRVTAFAPVEAVSVPAAAPLLAAALGSLFLLLRRGSVTPRA